MNQCQAHPKTCPRTEDGVVRSAETTSHNRLIKNTSGAILQRKSIALISQITSKNLHALACLATAWRSCYIHQMNRNGFTMVTALHSVSIKNVPLLFFE